MSLNNATNKSTVKVIEVIRSHGEVSRRLIAAETGLSTPSITRLVNELVDANVLSVQDSITVDGAGPGRPASVVRLNPLHCCAIGVDVGEHVIQFALGNMGGDIQFTSSLPTNADDSNDATFSNIVTGIKSIYELFQSKSEGAAIPLRAITVGVPGTVDPLTSKVVKAPMINGWTDYDLKKQLELQIPDVEIRIVNDINAAAIGESAYGVAKGYDNFVFASIRRGIGAGIFIDGKLYQGSSGFAGEMGKMVFDSSFEFSAEAGTGHFESTCGEDVLLRQAIERGVELEQADSGRPRLRSLASAAASGNTEATTILKSFLTTYGLTLANITSLLDPSIIVIGGELHPIMDMTVEQLTKTISRLVPSPPKIVGSALEDRAVLQGAFYQAHKDACGTLLNRQTV